MRIKVTELVLDYKGAPIEETTGKYQQIGVDKEGRPVLEPILEEMTWRKVIWLAMNQIDPQNPATAEEKLRAYQITRKAWDSAEPEFTVGERAIILEKIVVIYNPMVYGRAVEVFENGKKRKE